MPGVEFGGYELVRKLAAGGLAEIFLARRRGAAGFFRDVVLKRLFREHAEQPAIARMFELEALLMSHLAHPNIPLVLDHGQAEGTSFTVLEHVPGHTVTDVCRAGGRLGKPMPLEASLGVVLQLAEALHHVHECRDRAGAPLRIVHRDVNPHNVMLTPDGVAKLLDFGVAESAAHRDPPGTVRGTYAYMSPEQVRGEPLDRRSDVFALGIILYELTMLRRLFHGGDTQVILQVADGAVPRPSAVDPGYPQDLERIVLGALARDPEERTATAADLASQLETFAMRHRLRVGARGIAAHIRAVFPAAPEPEPELGLVNASPARRPVYVYHPPGPGPGPAQVETAPEPGVLVDDALEGSEYEAGLTALSGFDAPPVPEPAVVRSDPAEARDGAADDGAYVRELRGRLEADEPSRR